MPVVAALAIVLVPLTAGPSAAQRTPLGSASSRDALSDIADDLHSINEEIEDTANAVEEFDMFDQCMYLLGVSSYGAPTDTGYRYVASNGAIDRRAALALDLRTPTAPGFDFLAFPGEEPPQIECNEDAGGESTDE